MKNWCSEFDECWRLLLCALDSAKDATAPTLFASRIDGLLDPFWRQS